MLDIILILIVVIPLVLNILMLVSLSKQADERSARIKERATWVTFIASNGFAAYHVIKMFVESFNHATITPYAGFSPLLFLGFMSICYFCSLLYYKRKFGG